jgi:hypothetical protein
VDFGPGLKRCLDIIDSLAEQHGEAGPLAAVQVILSQWRRWTEAWPDDCREPTEAELRAAAEASVQDRIADIRSDPGPLRTIHKCDCGSVRRGGKWSKRNKVPAGWRTLGSVCTSCHDAKPSVSWQR